jgi:hypothetical protein
MVPYLKTGTVAPWSALCGQLSVVSSLRSVLCGRASAVGSADVFFVIGLVGSRFQPHGGILVIYIHSLNLAQSTPFFFFFFFFYNTPPTSEVHWSEYLDIRRLVIRKRMPNQEPKRVTQINLGSLMTRIPQAQTEDTTDKTTINEPSSKEPLAKLGRLRKRKEGPTLLEDRLKVIRGQPRELALASIGKSRSEGGNGLIVRNESPWETFKKVYECDLAGTVEVVARRSGPRVVHALR